MVVANRIFETVLYVRDLRAARQRAPLNQFYLALEATAARLTGDPRYEQLYDYERLVVPYELPVPEGWSSIASRSGRAICGSTSWPGPVCIDRGLPRK